MYHEDVREWKLSDDYAFLSDNWEQVKKVLSHAWMDEHLFVTMLMSACHCPANVGENVSSDSANIWKVTLQEKIPLLGHRNWIVVTDMAYPLQNKPGITTLFANNAYSDVLVTVQGMIHHSPHISATIYQDKEYLSLNDKVCSGIDSLKIGLREVFPFFFR